MKYCIRCGKPLADDDRFCGSCGAPQTPSGYTGFDFHPEVIESAKPAKRQKRKKKD